MTQEEILDYNKRCAEFLGWKQIKDLEEIDENNQHVKDCWFLAYTELVFWNTDVLKFHSDWNWIMEVVDAINKTQNPRTSGDTTHSSLKREVQVLLGKSIKEAVVQAINQFLIWYNENK